jgi:hypothetical protein
MERNEDSGNRIYNTRLLTYDIKVYSKVSSVVREWKQKDGEAIGVVITNLVSCYRKNRKLVYSRNTGEKALSKKGITTGRIKKAVDYLTKSGYTHNYIGKAHALEEKRVVSYILPTDLFIEKFCNDVEAVRIAELAYQDSYAYIELRDEDKNPVIFRTTERTKKLEEVVRKLNILNDICTIRDGNGDVLNNFYCRVFNIDFSRGGRFYRSDVLRIKNDESSRLDITINGNPVVEIDYGNLHFRIAAAREGIDLETVGSDVYSAMLDPEDMSASNRKIIKLAVNIMFNSLNEKKAQGAIQSEINKRKDENYTLGKASQVMSLIRNAYPQFKDIFCMGDGFGSALQYHDSELAADVLSVMIEKNIPCLPVHDSFIIAREHCGLLSDTMGDCFRSRFGTDGLVPVGINWKDNGQVFEEKVLV